MSGSSKRFRIFIPPGSAGFSLTIFCPRDTKMTATARFGKPPGTLKYSNYNALPFGEMGFGGTWEDFTSSDVIEYNLGGHITIGGANFYDPLEKCEAGWLYVKLDTYIGSLSRYSVEFTMDVYLPEFMQWFNCMSEDDWRNFQNPETFFIALRTF